MIPWYFNLKFPGFLVIFYYNQTFYRFTTYSQSFVHRLMIDETNQRISFNLYDQLFKYKLRVILTYQHQSSSIAPKANLYGPRNGKMEKFVNEILTNASFDVRFSKLIQDQTAFISDDEDDEVKLFSQHGIYENVLYQAKADPVALEITGNVSWLSEQLHSTYGNSYPWTFSLTRVLMEMIIYIKNSYITMILVTVFTLLVIFRR
ncbi:unnamed protein product [Didymodactylos carnosus]|nr:unnamed protein product [Didymodactylos carnosus]CAF4418372.1 unnamed protein product [Didymodactylos carnosus]